MDAGWAQAIGSVVAIIVAIWIAHKDSRERRNEAYAVALVEAVKTNQQVVDALLSLQSMATTVKAVVSEGFPSDAFLRQLCSDADALPAWSVGEIARLTPLPNRCWMHLAQGQAILSDARALLRASSDVVADLSVQDRRQRLSLFLTLSEKVREHFNAVQVELNRAKESLGHF